ncbi:MAG TPA: sulfotransferase [Fimbriimonadaceae bacterium]
MQRDLKEAEALCQQALALDPDICGAKLMLARIAASTGRIPLAAELLREVVAQDPESFDALMALAPLTEDSAESVSVAQKAAKLRPEVGFAHYQLGRSYLRAGNHELAVKSLRRAAQIDSNAAPVYHYLGVALHRSRKLPEAAESFQKSIALNPMQAGSYAELGHLFLEMAKIEDAAICYHQVAMYEKNPALSAYFGGLAFIYDGKLLDAEQHLRKALTLNHSLSEAHVQLAFVLQHSGRFEEAHEALQKSLDLDLPQTVIAQRNIAASKTLSDSDQNLIEQLEQSLEETPEAERHLTHYTLGKAYDDLGQYERAMQHFVQANELAQKRLVERGKIFDRSEMRSAVNDSIALFSAAFFEKSKDLGVESRKPIFIVGMPRSGTTLVEQILSSHPLVGAAGEIGMFTTMNNAPFRSDGVLQEAKQVKALAEKLLGRLEAAAPDRPFVTEKTPNNYMVLGPIHAAFPNARIIHCRRNALDTCLSIYTTTFMHEPEFSHVQADLVFAYREYERIFRHWRKVLGPETLVEIDYADLIADREPVIRRVLEFLGVDWSDNCMRHEDNEHPISTPSMWQARQPIYTRSLDRGKNYLPWLGALAELDNA